MTSPADCYRNWLKSLFWLQEFCQWDARSWSRSLWSFWHPLELTKQAPLPMLHHMSWWKDASPQGRLHLSQMPADATSNCCSTSINMLRDTTCITALYKAILRSKHSQNSFCWTSTFPGLNYFYFWYFASYVSPLTSLCFWLWWDETGKSIKKTLWFDSDMKHPNSCLSVKVQVVRRVLVDIVAVLLTFFGLFICLFCFSEE